MKSYKWREVLSIVNGKNQKYVENPNGTYPIYGSGGIIGYATDFLCPENSIILGRKGSINKPIFVKEKFWNVDTAFGIIPNKNILLPLFLYYFCIFFNFEKLNTTVTIPSLTKSNLLDITINIPDLKIQTKITNILSKIDIIIYQKTVQLSKLDTLVKSRFIEMFGDPVKNPYNWTRSSLEHSIKFITSGSRGWSQYFSNDGELFITIRNVKNSKIIFNEVQYIHPPKNAEAARTKVQEDDLLISITADLGRTGVVTKFIAEKGAYINQHLTCIRLDKSKLLPVFVSYFLESPAGKKQFAQKNQTGVKAGLNFDAIKSLQIFTPPLPLQEQFAAFVQQVDKSKFLCRFTLKKFTAMMTHKRRCMYA